MRTFHVGKMLPALAKANRIENIKKPPTPTLLCVSKCVCMEADKTAAYKSCHDQDKECK